MRGKCTIDPGVPSRWPVRRTPTKSYVVVQVDVVFVVLFCVGENNGNLNRFCLLQVTNINETETCALCNADRS